MSDLRDDSGKQAGPPFRLKHELLRGLISVTTGVAATAILNGVYKIRVAELGAYLDALPLPLLFISTGAFMVFSFVMRLTRLEWRRTRILTDCMLVLGTAGLSITLVAALNIGAVPLDSFDLTAENIYDQRSVVIPRPLGGISLRISGEKDPGFSLELGRRSAGNETIRRLKIDGLAEDKAITPGLYYFPVRGEFTVPGPFQAGDTVHVNIVNASSFGGKIKLELTGSRNRE